MKIFKMLCGKFLHALEPKQNVQNQDPHREQNKADFLKQNTFKIGRSGGVNIQGYLTATLQTA